MDNQLKIVLLPGLLCDHSMWTAQRIALSDIADVVVADLSGFASIGDMAASVLSSTPGPLVLLGHSMGGRVALEIVHREPSRVVGLALIDTGCHPRKSGEAASRQRMVDLAYSKGMAALAETWLPPMVDPRRRTDRALLDPLTAMVVGVSPEQHERQIRALLDRPDARQGLSAIRCPTLVMVGRQDEWSPVAQHEEMAAQIPGSKLVIIDDSGHMSLVERPVETAAALTRFVTGLRSSAHWPPSDQDAVSAVPDSIPDTPLFDRRRQLRGYRMNKMAMGLGHADNRAAFRADEGAYIDRFSLSDDEKAAVMRRDWREMVRLGGNLFFLLKISAVDPVRITEIGAHQAGMDHASFLRDRLGKVL